MRSRRRADRRRGRARPSRRHIRARSRSRRSSECVADEIRAASSRNRPEASVVARPIADGNRFSKPPTNPGTLVCAWTITVASGTGLPCGSTTRPVTNIRPGDGTSSRLVSTFGRGTAGAFPGSSRIARAWVKYPAPAAMAETSIRAIAAIFNLCMSMDLSTSRASAVAAGAAAKWTAARVVMSHRGDETDAEAGADPRSEARAAAGRTTPRRVSPRRSLSLARASRLRSVPSGQPSRCAASSSVRPSK